LYVDFGVCHARGTAEVTQNVVTIGRLQHVLYLRISITGHQLT